MIYCRVFQIKIFVHYMSEVVLVVRRFLYVILNPVAKNGITFFNSVKINGFLFHLFYLCSTTQNKDL